MKKIFLYIVIGFVLLAIPATVYFAGKQNDVRAKAAPATTLALSPASVSKQPGDTFKLNVDIDPASNQVTTVKVDLTYDSTKLEAQTITNGANAPRVLNSGIVASGSASIKVGAASNAQPIAIKGTVAVVTFKAKDGTGTTPTQVKFAATTFVGGLNESTANVLIGTTGSTITIGGAGNSTPTLTPTPTITLTPTLTPTIAASQSGQATPSAVQILTPTTNTSATSQPTIQGKAPPGSTVTIVIHSTEQTVVVTADANGNWSYTPTNELEPGPHNVVASILTATGTTQASSSAFIVAGAGEAGASQSGIPISGNAETTILVIGLGLLFILSGVLVPIFVQ